MRVRISTIALTLIIFCSIGCKKVYDYIDKNPTETCDACKVVQLKVSYNETPSVYNVSYDKKGNVTSLLTDQQFFSNFNFYFRYDKKNRVTDRIQVYPGNIGAVIWNSYVYFPDKIMDTAYVYAGLITDPHPPYDAIDKFYTELKTDAYQRITRAIRHNGEFVDTIFYKYNAKSNLIFNPAAVYDNKINPYRTNNMWQVTLRDFSANNATDEFSSDYSYYPQIVSYNSYGLPTKYKVRSYAPLSISNFGLYYDSLEVKYDCDLSKINY